MENIDISAAKLYSGVPQHTSDLRATDKIEREQPKGSQLQCDRSVKKFEETAIEKKEPYPFMADAGFNTENAVVPKRFTTYTSYLSQINSEPVDMRIVSIHQIEQKKKEVTAIVNSDAISDDEVCMWVDEPIVINLDSSDEDDNSQVKLAKLENDFGKSEDLLFGTENTNVVHEGRITGRGDAFGVARETRVASANDSTSDHRTTSQHANRHSNKRSYKVYAGTDANEEGVINKSQKVVPRYHVATERIKKRKSPESIRVSEYIDLDAVRETIVNADGLLELLPPRPTRVKKTSRCHRDSKVDNYSDGCKGIQKDTNNAVRETDVLPQFPVVSEIIVENHESEKTHQEIGCDVETANASETVSNVTSNEKIPECDVENAHAVETASSDITSEKEPVEANEVNKDCESESFSFLNEMDKLSRTKFDLSFITSTSPVDLLTSDQPIDETSVITTTNRKPNVKRNRIADMEVGKRGDARIYLTKEQAKLLLATECGYNFLNGSSETHQVKVRIQWECVNDVLVVVGTPVDQKRFHGDLIALVENMCKQIRLKSIVPRKKTTLIGFITQELSLLKRPLGSVEELFDEMTKNDNLKTKNGAKMADRARKNLNIILMGQAGLRDGKRHLAGLTTIINNLLEYDSRLVTSKIYEEIQEHYFYIFSSYRHYDYPALISEYKELQKNNNFPALDSDATPLESNVLPNEPNPLAEQQVNVTSEIKSATDEESAELEPGTKQSMDVATEQETMSLKPGAENQLSVQNTKAKW